MPIGSRHGCHKARVTKKKCFDKYIESQGPKHQNMDKRGKGIQFPKALNINSNKIIWRLIIKKHKIKKKKNETNCNNIGKSKEPYNSNN
jgi:hypothetical protein